MQEQTRTEFDGAGLAGGPSGLYFMNTREKTGDKHICYNLVL